MCRDFGAIDVCQTQDSLFDLWTAQLEPGGQLQTTEWLDVPPNNEPLSRSPVFGPEEPPI